MVRTALLQVLVVAAARLALGPSASLAAPPHPRLLTEEPDQARLLPPEPVVESSPAPGFTGVAAVGPRFGRRWTGHPRFLVLLLDFSDRPASREEHSPDYFMRFFFSRGEMENGSVRDWYLEASQGRFDFTGEARGWLRMPREYGDYVQDASGLCGNCYPGNARGLAADAVRAAVDAGIEFSRFDNDGPDGLPGSGDDDGIVDGLLLVVPGFGAERTGKIQDFRSHYWDTVGLLPVGSIRVPDYVLVTERENIGVAVHEIGHLLGGEDLYDVSGRGAGLGYFSIMAASVWLVNGLRPGGPDPFTRIEWGLLEPEVLVTDEARVEIPAALGQSFALRLWTQGEAGPEYFLVENRRPEGIDRYLPGEGLVVYHVDERRPTQNDPSYYRVGVVEADGLRSLEGGDPRNMGEPGDFFPGLGGIRVLNDDTTPGTRAHGGSRTSVALEGIGDPGPVMMADVRVGREVAPEPRPRLLIEPRDGFFAGGLIEGETGDLRLIIANEGARLPPGRLRLFTREPRVRVAPYEIDLGGISPLGSLTLEAPLRLGVDAGGGRPLLILEGSYATATESFPLAGALPLAANVVLREDFESASAPVRSIPVGSGGHNAWVRTRRLAAEGVWSMSTEEYPAYADAGLLVGPISGRGSGELRFRHRLDTPAREDLVYDGGFVEISRDGGRTWDPLEPEGGYPTRFGLSDGNAYPWRGAWGGQHEWGEVVVPLGELTGRTFLRFHFVSDYSGNGGLYQGWTVDAVEVRLWDRGTTVLFNPPEVTEGSIAVSFEAIPLVSRAAPVAFRLVRESGEGRDVLGEWNFAERGTARVVSADVEPGGVDRFWLEWLDAVGGRQGPLIVVHPGDPPLRLLDEVPSFVHRAAPGSIRLRIPGTEPQRVVLNFFDVRGARVSRLLDEEALPGWHEIPFPTGDDAGRSLAAGVYFLRLSGPGFNESRRILLVP